MTTPVEAALHAVSRVVAGLDAGQYRTRAGRLDVHAAWSALHDVGLASGPERGEAIGLVFDAWRHVAGVTKNGLSDYADGHYPKAPEDLAAHLRAAELALTMRRDLGRDPMADVIAEAERAKERAANDRVTADLAADRKIREAYAHLDRVLSELIRRGIATDLVPDSWRTLHADRVAEAEMRAGWPENVALAQRVRELEEALAGAQRREHEAHERRVGTERSRDEWIAIAIGLGYEFGYDPRGSALIESVSPELLTERSLARGAERAALEEASKDLRPDPEESVATWRNRAVGLGSLVRRLTRLPVRPTKVSSGELASLVWAVRPSQVDYWVTRGETAALPAAVVEEACRLEVEQAVDLHRSHAEIIYKTFDADGFRTRALAHLGIEPEATAGDAA